MATATVYSIHDGEVVEQFDIDYNYAIGQFFGKAGSKGIYYIAKKGVPIPYPHHQKSLRSAKRVQVDREQSS
jgi:hypothetical protein